MSSPAFSHLFFLNPNYREPFLVAAKNRCSGGLFAQKGQKFAGVQPQGVDWDGMPHYAAIAACCSLLLSSSDKTKTSELNKYLRLLQQHYKLQPILKSPVRGAFWQGFFAGTKDDPIKPFHHHTFQRGYLTEVYEEASLKSDLFQFAFARPSNDGWMLEEDTACLTASQLERALQKGLEINSEFAADWDAFSKSDHFPKLARQPVYFYELGPILKDYADMIGLAPERVVAKFRELGAKNKYDVPQWSLLGTSEDDQKNALLNLYNCKLKNEREDFVRLRQLLESFVDPDGRSDVPELMAEWLTAQRSESLFLKLKFDDFLRPLIGHGTGTQYRNAPTRLSGFECAFVRLELESNADSPVTIDRVTELLRHYAEPAGDKSVAETVPHSNLHVHTGDEFLYVVSGSVWLQLGNTGAWVPLVEGDVAHFNAEIPHALWHISRSEEKKRGDSRPETEERGRAVVLVVRFFQLDRHGTRRRQIDNLQKIARLMTSLGKKYSHAGSKIRVMDALKVHLVDWINDSEKAFLLWTQLAPWVHDRMRPPLDGLKGLVTDDSPIQDLVGLSRYLHTHLLQPYPAISELARDFVPLRNALEGLELRLEDLENDQADISWILNAFAVVEDRLDDLLTSKFSQEQQRMARACFEGVADDPECIPRRSVVRKLAKHLSLPPVLFDGYLAPPVLRYVIVRGAMQDRGSGYNDWLIPGPESRGDGALNAEYWIPTRLLANSDMLVTLLKLSKDGCSDYNAHPGFEVVLPLDSGKVRVEFKNGIQSEECGAEGMLVYRSAVPHRVCCVGASAKVLVLRFVVLDNEARKFAMSSSTS